MGFFFLRKIRVYLTLLLTILALVSCSKGGGRLASPLPKSPGIPETPPSKRVQYGVASWYGPDFHGKPTASGEIYDMYSMSAAHPSLQMGTFLMVTNLENGRSIEVQVNDRGPFIKGRVIDLSYAAARMLDMINKGTTRVRLEIVDKGPVSKEATFSSFQKRIFTLQLGSFAEEDNARRMRGELENDFKDVYILPFFTSSQLYYRVRIGRFDTKEDALNTANRIVKKGYPVLITSVDK